MKVDEVLGWSPDNTELAARLECEHCGCKQLEKFEYSARGGYFTPIVQRLTCAWCGQTAKEPPPGAPIPDVWPSFDSWLENYGSWELQPLGQFSAEAELGRLRARVSRLEKGLRAVRVRLDLSD